MSKLKSFFEGFKEGMTLFGSNIAIIGNSVLLTVVYLIGVGITSTIAKLFRKHFLELKSSKRTKSYWSDLNLKRRFDDYYRMF